MSSFENQYGVFRIDELRLGLPLSCLKEVVPLSEIMPFALKAPFLSGGIDLRGTLIPLVDLSEMLGLTPRAAQDRIVVVAISDGAMVGLVADTLDGVMESEPDTRTRFEMNAGAPQIINESFRDHVNGSYIHLLSPESIIGLPGMPKVRQVQRQQESLFVHKKTGISGHLMLMKAGALQIAIEPTAIHATILLNDITPPVVESDFYIGDTTYGGQTLPVVSSHELFGQGRQKEGEKEAFLIRYADGIVAFAVDRVVNVVPVHQSRVSSIPSGTVPNQFLFAGALAGSELEDHANSSDYYLVLDSHALIAEESLASISRLTLEHRLKRDETRVKKQSEMSEVRNVSPGDRYSMLIFEAGQLWATDIRKITEVLPLTSQINVFSERGYAQGLVFSRGKSIPVFCISALTHVPPPEELTSTSSILVVDVEGTSIGLLVTSLIGVEPVVWKKDESAAMTIAGGRGGNACIEKVRSIARTQSESGHRTVQTLDLTLIAQALIIGEADRSLLSGPRGIKPAAGE